MTGDHEATRERKRFGRLSLRRWRDTDAGQTLVEFSMILPVFLLLMFSIVDFGRAFYTWLLVTNAAREGARVGATQQPLTNIQTRVYSSISGLSASDLTMTTSGVQGPRGQPVTVALTYNFSYVTPIGAIMGLMGSSIATPAISATSTMRLE